MGVRETEGVKDAYRKFRCRRGKARGTCRGTSPNSPQYHRISLEECKHEMEYARCGLLGLCNFIKFCCGSRTDQDKKCAIARGILQFAVSVVSGAGRNFADSGLGMGAGVGR